LKNEKLLAPSILSANFANLSQDIRYTELAGADIIHCDIMDGQFVPNLSFGPLVVSAVNKITELPLDVHLMIKNPENLIPAFVDAGADFISVHQEEVVHLNRVLESIKAFNVKAGVVLNPATPLNTLNEIFEIADFILIMSVNPGFGGQSFIEQSLNKIKKLNEIRQKNNYNFLIEVDGGVNSQNIKKISDAGCNIFVAGSSIFSTGNIAAATAELKNNI